MVTGLVSIVNSTLKGEWKSAAHDGQPIYWYIGQLIPFFLWTYKRKLSRISFTFFTYLSCSFFYFNRKIVSWLYNNPLKYMSLQNCFIGTS